MVSTPDPHQISPRRASWLRRWKKARRLLLTPYSASPLGFALGAVGAALLALSPASALAGGVVAFGILIRLAQRHRARSPLAMELPTRRGLEWLAGLGALVTWALIVGLHGDTLGPWLWQLSGWQNPRLWISQLLLPGWVMGGLIFAATRREHRERAASFLRAYLFGHHPRRYRFQYAARVLSLPLLLLTSWCTGVGPDADHQLAAVARMETMADATRSREAQTTSAADPSARDRYIRTLWHGWALQPTARRVAVATHLPTLLAGRGEDRAAVIDGWLSALHGGGDRARLLDRLMGVRLSPEDPASEPADAVRRGLLALCRRAPGDCAAKVTNPTASATQTPALSQLNLQATPAARAQTRHLIARGLGWHALLGPWARQRGLCESTLQDVGWGGQATLIFTNVLCYGARAPRHQAVALTAGFAAKDAAPATWQLPGREGMGLMLSRYRSTTPGCKGGPCTLVRRRARCLRNVEDLRSRLGVAETQTDRSADRAWRRRVIHLWTLEANKPAPTEAAGPNLPLGLAWAGSVVLGTERLRQAHEDFPTGACRGHAARDGCTRFGVQLRATRARGARRLRLWRLSHGIDSCSATGLRGGGCARASHEEAEISALRLAWATSGGGLQERLISAEVLLKDQPLPKGRGRLARRRRRRARRARKARRALAKGDARWLVDLLDGVQIPTGTLVNRATLILTGGGRVSLLRRRFHKNDRLPVLRFVLRQAVLTAAAPGVAQGQKICPKVATALGLVSLPSRGWSQARVPKNDQWYIKFLGARPMDPLCELAPLIPVRPHRSQP